MTFNKHTRKLILIDLDGVLNEYKGDYKKEWIVIMNENYKEHWK